MTLRRLLPIAFLCFSIGGCMDEKDITGSWTFTFPPTTMELTLTPDGRYTGTVQGSYGAGAASGTYEVVDDTLYMTPPAVSGTTGLPPTFGGQMNLKMTRLSSRMIRLSDGQHEYTMERT